MAGSSAENAGRTLLSIQHITKAQLPAPLGVFKESAVHPRGVDPEQAPVR